MVGVMIKAMAIGLLVSVFMPASHAQRQALLDDGVRLPPGFGLGRYLDSPSGAGATIGDFRGKLLILDFWYTGCPACIADFPKLEALQREFGDRIQILLVNPLESEQQIRERVKGRYNVSRGLDLLFERAELPVLLASDSLKALLPPKGFPSHAWFDGTGRLRLFGSSLNTHPGKISRFLESGHLDFVHTPFTGRQYDPERPLLLQADSGGMWGSVFKPIDFAFDGGGASWEGISDTARGTLRDTYINVDVIRLFDRVLRGRMLADGWSDMVLHPFPNRYAWFLAYVSLEVADTFRYSRLYADPKTLTDGHFSAAGFCYEVVTPDSLAGHERSEWVYQDLKRYVERARDVRIRIETRDFECDEIVVRGQGQDVGKDGHGASLSSAIADSLGELFNKSPGAIRRMVFLGDAVSLPEGFSLPQWDGTSTLADFRYALGKFGLEMRTTIKALPVLVFSRDKR